MKKRREPFKAFLKKKALGKKDLGNRLRKKETFAKEKTTFVSKKEIALFLIFVLVVSIVGFSEVVYAQTNPAGQSAPDPNRLVVGQYKLKSGECVLEVGKYDELNERAMSAELSKAPKDKLIEGNLNLLGGKVDDSIIKQIQKDCGENVADVAKQMSSNPSNFKGQVNFEKGGQLKEFKNFQFEKLDKPLKIDGFGELSGDGKVNSFRSVDGIAQQIDLGKSGKFAPNIKKYPGLNKNIGSFGEGKWKFDKYGGPDTYIDAPTGGKINMKGEFKTGDPRSGLDFKEFHAKIKENGDYKLLVDTKPSDDLFKTESYKTIDLNNKFVDVPKNTNLRKVEFDENGLPKEIRIRADGGQVNGFGFSDKDSGVNIKGVSVEKDNMAVMRANSPESPGSKAINDYGLYGDGKGRVFYQYDDKAKNLQYIAPNDEKNALHVLKDKKLMSNQIDQKFLVNNKEVTIAKARTPDITKHGEVSPGVSKPLANDYIELVPLSNDIDVKSGSPAMKLFEKDGGVGITTKGIQNANVVGPDNNIIYKLNDGKLDATVRKSNFPLEIQNLDDLGRARGLTPDPNGNWVDLTGKFKNTGGNPFVGKAGSPSKNPSSNGLTWLLVIGGVGAIAAYAISKSGDKDKDKNKEKDVKNK